MESEKPSFTLVNRRIHKVVDMDHTRVIKLGNGKFIVTIPRELCRWKHVNKGTLLKWQDGCGNRLIVEVTPDNSG